MKSVELIKSQKRVLYDNNHWWNELFTNVFKLNILTICKNIYIFKHIKTIRKKWLLDSINIGIKINRHISSDIILIVAVVENFINLLQIIDGEEIFKNDIETHNLKWRINSVKTTSVLLNNFLNTKINFNWCPSIMKEFLLYLIEERNTICHMNINIWYPLSEEFFQNIEQLKKIIYRVIY